jgi:C-methyltransferase C-terminal domain
VFTVTRRSSRSAPTELLHRELELGFDRMDTYAATRRRLFALIDSKNAGRTVVGSGAPGRKTLLDYCGTRTDFLATRLTGIRMCATGW